MIKFFERIDIFGHNFNFTTFNQEKHRTYVGGIVTILTICSTLASTVYFAKDFWFKTNPKTKYERIQKLNYPKYKINKSNFVFGFRVEDSNLNFFDETSFFEFKVTYNNSTMTKNNITGYVTEYDAPVIYLNYSKCDYNKNFKDFHFISSEDNVDYRNFYCIDFSNDMSIGGYWTANFTQYIDIQLVYCNSSKPKCNNNAAAEYFAKNKLYINMMSLKYFIDLSSKTPIMNYLSYTYVQIDPGIAKKINCFMTQGLVTSNNENSYFIEDQTNYTSFNLDYWTIDNMIYSNNNNKITLTRIYFTRNLDRFRRTYVKLSDLIPIIVSMLEIISIFFRVIASFYNEFDWINRMLNELFDFSDYHESKLIKITERKTMIKLNLIKPDNQEFQLEESVNPPQIKLDMVDGPVSPERVVDINKDIEKSKDELINEENKNINSRMPNHMIKVRAPILNKIKNFLNQSKQSGTILNDNLIQILNEKTDLSYYLSFMTYLKNICCKNSLTENEKNIYKIFNKGKKILKEKTDIVSFLKTFDDMNEMKYVLFNKIQSLCFNFIRKPSLIESETEDKYSKFFNSIKADEATQKKDIINYFVNQSKNQVNSHYNQIFLDIIDDDIKMVIDIIKQNSCNLNII